ncbi:MAG: hypothetical protein GY854_01200, partial [Deltaproteobacteria bacterium]|nr:hypothetical protein [Deltaproteobacteria bacterium]
AADDWTAEVEVGSRSAAATAAMTTTTTTTFTITPPPTNNELTDYRLTFSRSLSLRNGV